MSLTWKSMLAVAATVTLSMTGCAKKKDEAAPPPPAQAASEAAPVSAPATQSTPAPATDAAPMDEKAAAIQAALQEEAIVSDPRGQWAITATASSTYSSDKAPESKNSYAPFAAAGAPNVERYGDDGNAWASEMSDKGIEWLEVKFAKPVQATQVRIRQSFNPGAIIKVELIEEGGARHAVWQGTDDTKYTTGAVHWFDKSFEKTAYKVNGARITLATNAVSGWNEIDAVQLLGE